MLKGIDNSWMPSLTESGEHINDNAERRRRIAEHLEKWEQVKRDHDELFDEEN